MNSRERILAAIEHKAPDKTPMDFGGTAMSLCTPQFLDQMRNILGYALPCDRDADGIWVDEAIQKYLNVDLRWVPWEPPLSEMKEIDPSGYNKKVREAEQLRSKIDPDVKTTAIRHDFPLKDYTAEQIKNLKPELPDPPKYMDWLIETADKYRANGYATTYWVSGGFFEAGCAARGYDLFAMDLIAEPDLVRCFFDKLLTEKLSQIETIIKPLADHIDIFCYGDDFGLQNGPFLSPESFRKNVMPYFKELYKQVKNAAPNSKIFHHSCGSVYRLLNGIIEMGVDVLNPIQPMAFEMDAELLKNKAKGRLCFHGGIDLQDLLVNGTAEQIIYERDRRSKILGSGGGYICAAAHSLPEDVKPESILALFGH